MMRLAVLLLLAPLLAAGEIIDGTVTAEGSPLPGCTVTLRSAMESWTTVSDGHGRYHLRYVPAGSYALTVELPGFKPVTRQLDVSGRTVVPPIELTVDVLSIVTTACTFGVTCSDKPPMSPWALPWCMNVEWNDALIESAERGNPTAIESLRHRYETAYTYLEKHTLAAALLRHVDDRAIRKELEEQAAISLQFPRVDGTYSDEFEEYCRTRNLSPDAVWQMSTNALKTLEALRPIEPR